MPVGFTDDRETAVAQLEQDLRKRGWAIKFRTGSRSWANPITKNIVIAKPETQRTLSSFVNTMGYLRVLAHESRHARDFGGRVAAAWRGLCYLVSRRYRLDFELRAILTAHRTVQLAIWNKVAPFGEGVQYDALLMRLLRLEGWRGPYWLGYTPKFIEARAKAILAELEREWADEC